MSDDRIEDSGSGIKPDVAGRLPATSFTLGARTNPTPERIVAVSTRLGKCVTVQRAVVGRIPPSARRRSRSI